MALVTHALRGGGAKPVRLEALLRQWRCEVEIRHGKGHASARPAARLAQHMLLVHVHAHIWRVGVAMRVVLSGDWRRRVERFQFGHTRIGSHALLSLLILLPFLGPPVLEPDLHLEEKQSQQ